MQDFHSQTQILNDHHFTDTFTKEYTSNQTDLTLITPSSGKRIKIVSVKIETKATTGQVKIYDNKSEKIVAILNAENNGSGDYEMIFVGAMDSTIDMTSTTGSNSAFIAINYTEVTDPTPLTTSTTTSTSTSTSTSTTISTSTSTS
jgi:hypothetical protein